jgi:predicted dithiol-disulfide oxidoreductase (DUF899 family)
MSAKTKSSGRTDRHPAHKVVSPETWLAARKKLLKKEKELTRLQDKISAQRRALPWTKVDQAYVFDGPKGKVPLGDLFDGRAQLMVYHFMFAPDDKLGCRICSAIGGDMQAYYLHLTQRDITLVAVSRAPFSKIKPFKKRMGWEFPWYSAYGSDFNFDYRVSFTPQEKAAGKVNYNYGIEAYPCEEKQGLSVFYKIGRDIYHTYSVYARGVEPLLGFYHYIDLAPKGRHEEGLSFDMDWVQYLDTYERRPARK